MDEEKNRQQQNSKIEIEINRFKHIVEALNNPQMLSKIVIVISLIIILVFIGISGIALLVKKFYPYKAVETNQYGATVIQSEDNEVTYWLFNSADLWANSGIEVKAGQILSIKTSGAFHTAIHHLVDDAEKNKLSDKWLRPDGGVQSKENKDYSRSKYRIAPEYEFNAILMQVLPKEIGCMGNEWYKTKTNTLKNIDTNHFWDYIDGGVTGEPTAANIYVIGEGRDNIEIQDDGILFFSCNDIALTPRKINSMKDSVNVRDTTYEKNGVTIRRKVDVGPFLISKRPYGNDNDSTELDYYKRTNYINAWFTDNVGSFLIVIERKKN